MVVALSVGSGAAPARRPLPAYKVVLTAIEHRQGEYGEFVRSEWDLVIEEPSEDEAPGAAFEDLL